MKTALLKRKIANKKTNIFTLDLHDKTGGGLDV